VILHEEASRGSAVLVDILVAFVSFVLVKKLAWKGDSKMTCFVSSET